MQNNGNELVDFVDENSDIKEFQQTQDKKVVKNIILVAMSNVFTLLAGVLTGFILPKILGLTDYGYYKTFTLYLGYVGLFHFGFCDGIFLYFAGRSYDSLQKDKMRVFTRFLIVMEGILTLIVCLVSSFYLSLDYGFIFFCVSITMFFNNVSVYYQMISQVTYRFKELSIINCLRSILNVLSVGLLAIFYYLAKINVNYRIYVYLYLTVQLIITVWYIIRYRDITFGKGVKVRSLKKDIISFFLIGFPLLLANLVNNLILNIDRQFVSILFDTDTYGIYAFAYNMLSLISVAIASVSTVLYPSLKTKGVSELAQSYGSLNAIMLILLSASIMVYFPLFYFVNYFLPQYSEALIIFRIILPGFIFSSSISIVMANYYKSFNQVKKFFIISLVALVLSIIANFIAYLLCKETYAISIASIIVMIIWYLIAEYFLIKQYKVKWFNNFIYACLLLLLFYLCSGLNIVWLGFIIYLVAFLILTLILQKKAFFGIIKKAISFIKRN